MRRTSIPVRSAPVIVALLVAGCAGYSTASGGAGAATRATAATAAPAAPAITAAMIAEGDSLFNSGGCQRCHGQKGVGAKNAPSLVEGPWLHSKGTMPELIDIITTGVAKEEFKDAARPFAMRPRGGPANLTDAQVRSVAAYVHSISRGKK